MTPFSDEILVLEQEFLINGAGDVGQEALPIHREAVDQCSPRRSTRP